MRAVLARCALAALIVVAILRVAATATVFAQTIDEPAHLAAGSEWLSNGEYRRADAEHPPLARAIAALPLHLAGIRAPARGSTTARGNAMLLARGRYRHDLALARRGNLLFLALALATVAAWGRAVGGRATGLVAALLYASLPPVLAHAGLATTDMAAAATIPAALLALRRWRQRASWPRALVLGLAAGVGLAAKFSFLPFFLPAAAGLLLLDRPLAGAPGARPALRARAAAQAVAAVALAGLLVWAVYGFRVGELAARAGTAAGSASPVVGAVRSWASGRALPAPRFLAGLLALAAHDERGHPAFLLGEVRRQGWHLYFPVAILFKTPLAVLLLAGLGTAGAIAHRARDDEERRARRAVLGAAAASAAMLAVAMASTINIGVRHVLPLYAPLAVVAAAGATHLARRRRGRWLAVALVSWTVLDGVRAYPDDLAWFNPLAGGHPERILGDSNLDWGQDVLRLRAVCRAEHIALLHGAIFTSADLRALGLPPLRPLDATAFTRPGWIAVSETMLQFGAVDAGPLAGRPFRRVGSTIRLYRVEAAPPAPPLTPARTPPPADRAAAAAARSR